MVQPTNLTPPPHNSDSTEEDGAPVTMTLVLVRW